MLAGILIGIFLGLGLALGVTLWVNRGAEAFRTPAQKQEPKPVSQAPGKTDQDAGTTKKSPYTFYGILQGDKTPAPEAAPDTEAVAERPADKPDTPASRAFFVQAGAFQKQEDAESLRGKLALVGIESEVQSVSVPERGTLHRVRTGPFPTREEAERAREGLARYGLQGAVVR